MVDHLPSDAHATVFSFVMLTPVLLLYGLYVLCTVALIWAAIAVTRHIVLHRRATRSPIEHHDDPV